MSLNPRLINTPSNHTFPNGRITAVSTTEGTTHYNYSCQNNLDTITKENESLNFTYDGTLVTTIVQSGTLNETLAYTYNNNFLTNSITYAETTTAYSYDLDHRLIQSGDFNIQRNNQDYNHSISNGSYTKD